MARHLSRDTRVTLTTRVPAGFVLRSLQLATDGDERGELLADTARSSLGRDFADLICMTNRLSKFRVGALALAGAMILGLGLRPRSR